MAKTLDAAGVKRLIQEIKGANNNLNAPIPISTENTPESMAQNVKNIADYVEKAKAAGIADVNGMAVTCIIAGNYSGVGYLYGEDMICGTTTYDDLSTPYNFVVQPDGLYTYNPFIVKGTIGQVTSDMLVEGARNPIILTPDTTEVDEETYQKLLSDDVDVVFKLGEVESGADFCTLVFKEYWEDGGHLQLYFTNLSPTSDAKKVYFDSYFVDILDSASHKITVTTLWDDLLDLFLEDSLGFLPKNKLSPVLQEIDLTGTDADRKAKLDQFETDWKALTGADDLTGARFVGKFGITDDVERNVTGIMTYSAGDAANDATDNCFYGICNGYSFSEQKSQIAVKVSCTDGSLTITPLFSHLEAITIYTDNTPEHMQANLDNIAAYEANLQALGVDTTKSPMIPCGFQNLSRGWITKSSTTSGEEGHLYVGIARDENGAPYTYFISVNPTGKYSKYDAINSGYINNNFELGVVGVQANAKSLEAITIKTKNTPEDKAANISAIKAYVDNLKALGVDVTKGYMIPCKFPNSVAGVLSSVSNSLIVAIITNGRGELNCYEVYIGGDNPGAVYSIGGFQLKISFDLTTTSKQIVGAINEINANAVHKDKFVPTLEAIAIKTGNTPDDKDANVAAIKAYVNNLKALGVDTTKGYMIPIKASGRNGFLSTRSGNYPYAGYAAADSNVNDFYNIMILGNGEYYDTKIQSEVSNTLNTISKRIADAINEVNALAKGYSTIFTPIELTTETAQNKTAIDARVAAFTAQGISLTNGCCIPVTYKGVYAGNISLINGDWYGLLVKNTNNPADNINIKLSADGTITEGNSAQ